MPMQMLPHLRPDFGIITHHLFPDFVESRHWSNVALGSTFSAMAIKLFGIALLYLPVMVQRLRILTS